MVDEQFGRSGLADADSAFDALQELESQTSDDIRSQRSHDRLTVKAAVTLQAGNSSEMLKWEICGVTGDVSSGGCRAMFPVPCRVGDIYRLQIEHERLNVPMVFARCLRCQLIREDAYEAGFKFFTLIDLKEVVQERRSELLI